MNSIATRYGLAARQWAINTFETFASFLLGIFSIKGVCIGILTLMLCSSCKDKSEAQNLNDKKTSISKAPTDSLDKPKVNIKVNRHYDDKGNLVGFDSTYSSFYSNIKGDTLKMDSAMNSFDTYFNRNHSSLFDRRFNNLFFNDSLRYPDFFHKDFFMKRYELNDTYMRDMMRSMDSVKNRFFSEQRKH